MSFAAFKAHVVANFAVDGVTATVELGKDFVARRCDPLTGRVVFVPKGIRIAPLDGRVGGNPRPVALWKQIFEVHCAARAADQVDDGTGGPQMLADLDAGMALAQRTLVAVHFWADSRSTLEGTGEFTPGNKTTEYGTEVVFDVVVDFDVLDAPWAAETGVTPVHTGTMTLPLGNADGCGG